MKRLLFISLTAVAIVLALFLAKATIEPTVAWAGSGTVTIQLLDSDNDGLAGGDVYYYQGGWQLLDTTDNTGTAAGTVPITTDIELRYAGGKYKWTGVDPSTTPTLTINTVKVTVKLQTCGGTPLAGDAKYYFGGFTSIGNTPATIELLPYSGLGPDQGNYDFQVKYNGRTSPIKTQDISDDPVVVFKTTKVSLFGTNVLYYNNGGWQPLTSPMEMIGGTSNRYGTTSWVDVKFDGPSSPTVRLDVDGCSLSGGLLTLVDNNDQPLANYPSDFPGEQRNLKAKYRCGGSWGPTTSFKTNANGQFFMDISCPSNNWDKKVTVTLNQTTREQNVVTGSSTFKAAKVKANLLKSCSLDGIAGGNLDQGGGYWYDQGNTGANGTASFFAFPGNNVKLRMSYNHNSQTKTEPVTAGVTDIDFETTAVTLDFPGAIRSNKGGSWWIFDKPTMDLLPGNYDFWFKIGNSWTNQTTITVSGCELSQAFALLKVKDENGNGVAGGKATPAIGGSWQPTVPGQTDANGKLFAELPIGYTKIKMVVNQGGEEQNLAQLGASDYTWETQVVRINLKDHTGAAIIDENGVLDQGGGYWYNWGNLNDQGFREVQLFPGSYKFRMTYNYTSQEKSGIAVTAGAGIQEVNFQTGQVNGSCITQYSTGAWRTFTDGMELMPGTYTFKSPSQPGTVTAGGVTELSCP